VAFKLVPLCSFFFPLLLVVRAYAEKELSSPVTWNKDKVFTVKLNAGHAFGRAFALTCTYFAISFFRLNGLASLPLLVEFKPIMRLFEKPKTGVTDSLGQSSA
jgi:hypothetical protein